MPDEEARRRRRAARDRIMADRDGFAERLYEANRASVPGLAHLTAAQRDVEVSITRRGMDWVFRMWIEGDWRMTAAEVAFFRQLAVMRVREGRPLEVMIASWTSGFRSFPRGLEAACADLLTTADMAEMALLAVDGLALYTDVVSTAYRAAEERFANEDGAARSAFLVHLLQGWPAADSILAESARRAGVALPPSPTIVTVAVERSPLRAPEVGEFDALLDGVALSSRSAPEPEGRALRAIHASTGIAVLPSAEAQEVSHLAGRQGWCAASIGVRVWSDCRTAHQLTRFALRTAPPSAFAGRRSLNATDVRLLGLLRGTDGGDSKALSRDVLGALLAPDKQVLRESLEAYLSAGSLREAAQRQLIHEQTLRYRMKQIQELTGRDIRSEWDVFVLRFASAALPWTRSQDSAGGLQREGEEDG